MTSRFGDAAHLIDALVEQMPREAFIAKATFNGTKGHFPTEFPPRPDRPLWWVCLPMTMQAVADEMIRLGVWSCPE